MENYRIVPVSEYNLKERTSIARLNPNLVLIENIKTGNRKWVYRQSLRGGKN